MNVVTGSARALARAASRLTGRDAPSAEAQPTRRLRVPRLEHAAVRSYEVIRSAHLERAREFVPASLLYARQRYDFDPTLTTGVDLHRVNAAELVAALLLRRVTRLEVNEPLQLSGLPRAAVAVAAAQARGALRRAGTPVQISCYAIENRDPFADRPDRLRTRVRRAGERRLAGWLTRRLDRIAFGTPGAELLYRELLGAALSGVEQRTVPALPARCACLTRSGSPSGNASKPVDAHPAESAGNVESVENAERVDPGQVLFVGALHTRKGLEPLLSAWRLVAERRPDAHLTVVGSGTPSEAVAAAMEEAPTVRFVPDPPRERIHAELRRASLLVLLSQPSPTWREQVGLPIVEGLAHGCRVLTTDQTGLADWLIAHGHHVLSPDAPAQDVASVIIAALDQGPDPDRVLADLPSVDGRQAADAWLLTDHDPSAAPVPSTRSAPSAPSVASRAGSR